MARPGVTYTEISAAANELMAQGKNPTIELVRRILGTGSSTTIANHLREWKEAQEKTNFLAIKENIPQELVGTLKGLWERVLGHADEKNTTLLNDYTQSILALQHELEKYKNNNRRWQKLFNKWMTEKNQLEFDYKITQNKLETLNESYITIYSKHNSFLCELDEKDQRIHELHKLYKQIQDNFENDRKLVAEQQVRTEEKHEKQLLEMERRNQEMQHKIKIHELNYETLQSNYEINLRENLSLINEKNKNTQVISHWQQENKMLQKCDDEKNITISSMHNQISVLMEQLSYSQNELLVVREKLKNGHKKKISEPIRNEFA